MRLRFAVVNELKLSRVPAQVDRRCVSAAAMGRAPAWASARPVSPLMRDRAIRSPPEFGEARRRSVPAAASAVRPGCIGHAKSFMDDSQWGLHPIS